MTLLVLPATTAGFARAQASGEAASAAAEQQREELHVALAEPGCVRDEFQPDTIVVCAEAEAEEATRAVMSPLPAPVQSDRNLVAGLRDQPCWISRVPGVLCVRGGFTPPQVVLIDLGKFPDALTPEEAAQVFAVEDDDPQQ